MTRVPNERDPYVMQGVRKGDFVWVALNADPVKGFHGYVISASSDRLRIKAHTIVGSSNMPPCFNREVLFPMASIAFICQTGDKPVDCPCGDLP